ncbi:MAG: molybdate ABC transporter substrate-binding protein [Intrasporangiaceae bacterium]|nr:molybdate ABC transporter substrate-binding protein [Intrasporangiaceae bacterium]
MRRLARAASLALAASLLVACSGPGGSDDSTVRVLAAASLTDAVTELADAYEDEHPGVTVEVSFGSSSTLAQQVTAGADVDVFASAGKSALGQLPASLTADERIAIIATTTLEIAVPPGNPAGITGIADLVRPDLDVVLCAETAPCGGAADAMFDRAAIVPNVVSRELDARATLAKVALGEADAAVVYRADVVTATDQVAGVEIPAGDNVTLSYPMVRVTDGDHTRGFVDLVTSATGLAVLADAGFGPP